MSRDSAVSRDQLFIEAMDLLISLGRRIGGGEARAQIEAFCAGGADHRSVWREVLEIDGMAGAVLSVDPAEKTLTRRNMLLGGIAIGAGGLAAGATLPGALRWLRSDYATARAQVLPVHLPDGSEMTLGPRSTVALDFDTGQRRVELLEGMAILALRPPRSGGEGPFVLTLGDISVSAAEADFDISRDAGVVSVAVLSGALRVDGQDAAILQGQRLSIPADGAQPEISELPVDQMALWREGQIMADNESVAAMVAKVARWHSGKVVITDDALAQERVSGIYNLDDPTAALQAIVGPHGGRIRQISSLLTLVSAG